MARAAAAKRASKGSGNAALPQGNEACSGSNNSRRRRRSRDLAEDDADPNVASEANDDSDAEDAAEESPRKNATSRSEDPHEVAESCLAEALAAFLRDNHPRGLALGALAGSEVRQSLRDPMRDAGVRSFKAKFLSRFPAELLFDGKMVRPAPTFQPASRGGSGGDASNEEFADGRKAPASRLTPAALALQPVPALKQLLPGSMPRSCLRRSSEPGVGAQTRDASQKGTPPRRASFANLIDVLVFKLGHEPGAVSARGQHVRRPMNQVGSDEEEDDNAQEMDDEEDDDDKDDKVVNENDPGGKGTKASDHRQETSKADRNSLKYAKAKDHWLDPSMLPPEADEEEEEEEDTCEFYRNVAANETRLDLGEDDDEDSDWVKV